MARSVYWHRWGSGPKKYGRHTYLRQRNTYTHTFNLHLNCEHNQKRHPAYCCYVRLDCTILLMKISLKFHYQDINYVLLHHKPSFKFKSFIHKLHLLASYWKIKQQNPFPIIKFHHSKPIFEDVEENSKNLSNKKCCNKIKKKYTVNNLNLFPFSFIFAKSI